MLVAVAVYCIAVGVLMGAWWGIALAGGALQRQDRSRSEMVLHLAAEFLAAAWLVTAGVALLVSDGARPFAALGLGMLAYTVIVSPGYFVARGERAPVMMFGVLGATTALAVAGLLAGA